MNIYEGKRPKEQKLALLKLVWGLTVTIGGLLGIIGLFTGNHTLIFLGAALDILDTVLLLDLGSVISSAFFAVAGVLVCFFTTGADWLYGMCVGLCFESAIGGIIGYSWRLSNFIAEEKGPFLKKLKHGIRRFLRIIGGRKIKFVKRQILRGVRFEVVDFIRKTFAVKNQQVAVTDAGIKSDFVTAEFVLKCFHQLSGIFFRNMSGGVIAQNTVI